MNLSEMNGEQLVQQILTELMEVLQRIEVITNFLSVDLGAWDEAKTAINLVNATEQINQQQWERVECKDCGRKAVLCSTCIDRLIKIVKKVEQERVEKLKATINALLSCLPDSARSPDWRHAWDELNDNSQDIVKDIRKAALKRTRGRRWMTYKTKHKNY